MLSLLERNQSFLKLVILINEFKCKVYIKLCKFIDESGMLLGKFSSHLVANLHYLSDKMKFDLSVVFKTSYRAVSTIAA